MTVPVVDRPTPADVRAPTDATPSCSDVFRRVQELEAELELVRRERDALRLELAESERLRSAIDRSPIGIMCVAIRKSRYAFSNEAHARLIGVTREEVLAGDPYQRWVEITHPEDFERERAAFQQLIDGESDSFQLEKRLVRRDGEVRWTLVHCVALRDESGICEHVIGYFIDIHDQRQAAEQRRALEAQLRQAHKLEALGKLAGGVAHDFNNRLVIIMGYTELLRQSLPQNSPLAYHADMVLTSSQRAAELTRQLLAYSRRQVLKPQTFNLNDCVDGMRRLLERLIGDDIELTTVLGARNNIVSDPGQIEQVIINLAINGRDAMPSGGRLTLTTRDVTVSTSQHGLTPGDYVVLDVIDSGVGIPPDVLPFIFEPFYTTKDASHGTGLGLATVEGIVRQSGGAVQVQSRMGEGATFTVYLPRAEAGSAEVHTPLPEVTRRALVAETLLVCDDDENVRKLLVDVLRLRSSRVLEAHHGKHALEVAREYGGPVHLLVTDVRMPELGGRELASELRKLHPSLKVLYLSGYTDDSALLGGTLEPGAAFLAKPFLPGDLTRTVASMLTDGEHHVAPVAAPSKLPE